MELRIHMDAEVKCDGEDCGRLERVVLDPARRIVTHLVVRLHDGERRVVGTELIAEAHADWIHLHLSCERLREMPPYLETDFCLPSPDWAPPHGYAQCDVLWPGGHALDPVWDPARAPLSVEHHNVPASELEVSGGERVFCQDRECGRVADLVMDPVTDRAQGFVIRRGFLFARDVEVPMGWIESVDEAGVHLKMTAEQLEALAKHFP